MKVENIKFQEGELHRTASQNLRCATEKAPLRLQFLTAAPADRPPLVSRLLSAALFFNFRSGNIEITLRDFQKNDTGREMKKVCFFVTRLEILATE